MTRRKQPVPIFSAIEGAVAATNMLLREGLMAVPVVAAISSTETRRGLGTSTSAVARERRSFSNPKVTKPQQKVRYGM